MARSQKPATRAAAVVDDYDRLHREFRWQVPVRFSIADACCGRWADGERIAILYEDEHGIVHPVRYRDLHREANRLANALHALGVRRGDRVPVILPQRPQTAVAHFALYRLGAIAMPMSMLFGPDSLGFRFGDSAATTVIVDASVLEATRTARTAAIEHLVVVGDGAALRAADGEHAYDRLIAAASDRRRPVVLRADEPADLIYTSGTTGPPKGALIAHRSLIGNLTGFVASQNWFPRPADVFWSPADWAWTGGLMDALLPTLYFGHTIVATASRFSAARAYELIDRHRVTNAFLFPTALKQMMRFDAEPRRRHQLHLRAIMSAGETVGATLFDWCRDGLGVTVNEMFGQTELNYVVGNSAHRWPARPGSIGRAYPGHRVSVIDDAGRELPPGELGEVAVHRFDRHGAADPVFFLEYWRNPAATAAKYSGNWCRTGDLATADSDGYLWYGGRADDMFKAAGYRIGPGEIENCLLAHAAVANVAVVPKPDPDRGNLVKAYVVLAEGARASPALVAELQEHVRGKLAPYEYPKEVEFIDELPMTTTGKVQRRVLRLREETRARDAGSLA